ncbi:MAG TPA: CopG family transcriptional regulator [Gammaproteobacteria bacterium]|nr:CopG family transcriptional regulator [Gammaproteobacteria bacterium]
MGRLTISLTDERHLALKEAAAREHKSIREIIESSLDYYGIKTKKTARSYVAMARENSGLSAEEAMTIAVQETQASRRT